MTSHTTSSGSGLDRLYVYYLQVIVMSNPFKFNFGVLYGDMLTIFTYFILNFKTVMVHENSYVSSTLRIYDDYPYVLPCSGDPLLNRYRSF